MTRKRTHAVNTHAASAACVRLRFMGWWCILTDSRAYPHMGRGRVRLVSSFTVSQRSLLGVTPMMYSLSRLRPLYADDVHTLDASLVTLARACESRAARVLTDGAVLLVTTDAQHERNAVRAALAAHALVTQSRVCVSTLDVSTLLVSVCHA